MMNKFRDLKVDEVELRINRINEYGCSLLLYKNARCDMSILDETVGPMNWKREHTRNNANCIVSIWDEEKKQWISKEDTGKESNAEKEKASDSFKRACVNWGIGRELYTAPDIWISAGNVTLKDDKNGKKTTHDKFSVVEFEVEDKKIVKLAIRNDTLKKIVYTMNSKVKQEEPGEPGEPTEPKKYECHNCGKPFQPFTDIDGKVWSEGQVYHLAESRAKKAGIAGVFCSACLKKKQEAKADV